MYEKEKLVLIRNVIRWYSPINTQVKVNCVLEYLLRSKMCINKFEENEILQNIADNDLKQFFLQKVSIFISKSGNVSVDNVTTNICTRTNSNIKSKSKKLSGCKKKGKDN